MQEPNPPAITATPAGNADGNWAPHILASIGDCFVLFCRAQESEFNVSRFQLMLKCCHPLVRVVLLYRDQDPEQIALTEERGSGQHRYWGVFLGDQACLLPAPARRDRFHAMAGFQSSRTEQMVMPGQLAHCVPAMIDRVEDRWVIVQLGEVSAETLGGHRRGQGGIWSRPGTSEFADQKEAQRLDFAGIAQVHEGWLPAISELQDRMIRLEFLVSKLDAIAVRLESLDNVRYLEMPKQISRSSAKITPDQESKQPGPPPPPAPTVRQKVGLCFVKFCRGRKGEYPLGAFAQMVTEAFEGVSVKLVYRNAGTQEKYLTEQIEGCPHRGWLVNAGNENMLLPCPVKADKFENSGLFEGGESVGPATIESCLPGLLQRIDQRWDITDQGKLATQRDLDLPPWDKPDREASMENGSRAEGGSGQPRTTASGSTAPLDAVILGAMFVRFCREAVVPGKPITLCAFCQYIADVLGLTEVTAKRLWLGQAVSGSELALYTDPTTLEQSQSKTVVWLIVPGGSESKDGLLLPEVMADGRFAELQPAFRGDRGQTPGTVTDVNAARVERNEKNYWFLKTPGRVAGTAGTSVGPAEEVRVVVESFLAACREVAGNEESKRALISREEAMGLLRKQFEKRGAKPELQELIWKGCSIGGAGQFEVRPKHRVDVRGGYVLIRFGGYANAVREYLVPLLGGPRLFADLTDNRGFKFANTNVLRPTPGSLIGFEPCLLTAIGNGVFDVSKAGRMEWT